MQARAIVEQAELLRPFASEVQVKYLDAIIAKGSVAGAAKELGVARSTVRGAMAALTGAAALKGHSPEHNLTHTVPEPFFVKGYSTLYNGEGQVAAQWIKANVDDQRRATMMQKAVEVLSEGIPPLPPVAPSPEMVLGDCCNQYTLSDCHLGMLAWHKEGGSDWDLKIAEDTLYRLFDYMVSEAPAADTAIVAQLGDWLHFDGLLPTTPTSGHIVDADSRFQKVIEVAIRLLERVVLRALETHKKVILVVAEGNHDLSSSHWLAAMFRRLFRDNPRVEVVASPKPYYVVTFGKVFLAYHHGHMKKMTADLALLFAAEHHDLWGVTEKRYCHTGHLHHPMEDGSKPGIVLIQHPTLASRDAYASRHGFYSWREARRITYHREWGQVGTSTVTPEMLP